MNNYQAKIDFWLDDGTHCIISLSDYIVQKPNRNTWDSDIDYYGYEEFEYDMLDLDGKPLAHDLSENEVENVEQTIRDYCEDERNDY